MVVGGVRRAGGGVQVQEEGRSGMLPAGEETQQKGVMTESDIKKKSKDIEKADDGTAGIPEELMEVEEDEELVEEDEWMVEKDEANEWVEEDEEWPVYHLYNEIWPVSEEFP